MTTTQDLIESIVRDAAPVRRLASPWRRAALFLAGFAVILWVAVAIAGTWPPMIPRLQDSRFAIEMAATAFTGIAAVTAAFFLSIPGRSQFWSFLPLPSLALWLGTSGYGCCRNWFAYGADESLALGRSANCFVFLLSASIPLAAALFLVLRRAQPLDGLRVMTVGALGVAALAATALQFFHPFDVTVTDLAVHVATASLIIAISVLTGAPRLRSRAHA